MNFELAPEEVALLGKTMATELLQSIHFQELIEAEVAKRVEGKKRLTLKQLAEALGKTPRTISQWVREGKIVRCYPCGSDTLFDLGEVYQDIDRYHGTDKNLWYKKAG